MIDKKILNDFIRDYRICTKDRISVITIEALSELKSVGYSVEDLLDHLSKHYQSLLHGSRIDISDGILKQNRVGKVYASDLAAIAIMRAIISNKELTSPGLQYHYRINENHPLEVRIHGINNETIGYNGFVYVLNQVEGFENDPKNSWQYVKKGNDVLFSAKIEVIRDDFKYPIFDVTNGKRIQ